MKEIKYNAKVWKTGMSHVITIKTDDMTALNLKEGDLVHVILKKVENNET